MQGDEKIIQYLNKALSNEMTTINQYFLDAKMLEHRGLNKLGKIIQEESIEEMRHADALIKRILMINGSPQIQSGKIRLHQWPKEMFETSLALETEAVHMLREAIAYCDSQHDYVTSELFQSILQSEEKHVHWLEAQLGLIKQMGEQNYLQSQI